LSYTELIYIFDLDGTVICTKHRYRNKPGTNEIDLDYWFANSVPEKIALDKLLPLADVWRRYHAEGHTIVVCTARQWSRGDAMTFDPGPVYEQYLADNGLPYHALLHRELVGPDHASYSDGDLKTKLLNDWAAREGLPADWRKDAVMFDDNTAVIRKMFADRLICLNAIKYNERLAA
jgi:hypothetical protein